MSAYCVKGKELLLDLKRSDWLPPHDEEGIRTILSEVAEIHQKLETIIASSDNGELQNHQKIYASYFYECLCRNKRYLSSYTNHRLQRIRQVRWEYGAVLPDRVSAETLSAHEKSYFAEYNNLVTELNESIGFDLTADLEPPTELLIEVRVLQDCGKVMTESGPVSLDKGSIHFLRRSQVESFIREGKLEHVANHSL